MPRFQPNGQSRRRSSAAYALLLATTALAWTAPGMAKAEDLGLRGAISEEAAIPQPDDGVDLDTQTGATPPTFEGQDSGLTGTTDSGDAPASRTLREADRSSASDSEKTTARPRLRKSLSSNPQEEEGLLLAPLKAAESTGTPEKALGADQEEAGPPATNARAQPIDAGVQRTGSVEGMSRQPDSEPFAALGIRAGSFVLRPTLEQGLTATSNADSSYGGGSALLSETTLRLNALSDWRLHSASLDGSLTYRKTLSGAEVEDVRGNVEGTLNLDLGHDFTAFARLGYEAAPESASSPVIIGGTTSQPLRQTFEGSLGVEKALGKARLGLTGTAEREVYGDAELISGGTQSQKDRNSTLYSATLRGGYAISPALTPFVEFEAGRRLYDQRVDDSGYERSAIRLGARAGLALDRGEKLSGEFSAGWLREAIDDDRLESISGLTINADLRWSPLRGTTVGLSGATTVEGTTTPGESGSVLYSGRLSLDREIRSNLTGSAVLSAEWRDYVGSTGHDLTLGAEASLTWWLNRYAGLTARARTEKLTSNLAGREETTNSVFVGLKLQR